MSPIDAETRPIKARRCPGDSRRPDDGKSLEIFIGGSKMSELILMTPDGKRVKADMKTDVCLYDAPHNPPNTGTAYTRGTDLYAHKARSGQWYFYTYHWSMWQGEESGYGLISEDEAQTFILEKAGLSGHGALSDNEADRARSIWPDIFEETA